MRLRKSLAEKEAGMALGLLPLAILQHPEGFIAKLRIEISGPPAGGIQPSPMAASAQGLLFRQSHDSLTETLAAEILRNPEKLDQQPSIGRSPDEPGSNLPFIIAGENSEGCVIARRNVLPQGCEKTRLDLIREGPRVRLDRHTNMGKPVVHGVANK
jgi:hypothetical protein